MNCYCEMLYLDAYILTIFLLFKLIKNEIVLFRHFQIKFLNSKFRGVYKRAVVEALEVDIVVCFVLTFEADLSNRSFKYVYISIE